MICLKFQTAILVLTFCVCTHSIDAADQLGKQADWQVPEYSEIRSKVHRWSEDSKLAVPLRQQLFEIWPEKQPESPSYEHLSLIKRTAVMLDKNTQSLIELISSVDYQSDLIDAKWLKDSDSKLPAFVRDNLRLTYGKWLAEQHLFDEALEQLSDLKQDQVADPAMLLFYKAVCQHHLLKKEDCVATLGTLISGGEEVPVRYLTVSKLMLSDITPLKEDSLDEVARLMRDIERRLGLGRAGKNVRKEEEDVIAKLDKMIDELEKKQQQQQQQQQQSGSGNSNQNQPSKPLQDSNPAGGQGPGNIDPRKLEDKDSWGNLPPKQRQEALQQISNEFPSHYRKVIDEYFRKLAREEAIP